MLLLIIVETKIINNITKSHLNNKNFYVLKHKK